MISQYSSGVRGGRNLPLEAVDEDPGVDDVPEGAGQDQMACGVEFDVAGQPQADPDRETEDHEEQAVEAVVRPGLEQREGGGDAADAVHQQRHLTRTETAIEQPVMKMVAVRR